MVHTFETIQLFGFGNPVLLADGISEALLTTQAGLLVAFPLMLAYNYLASRVEMVEDDAWSEALKFEAFVFEKSNGSAICVESPEDGTSPDATSEEGK